MPLDRTEQAHRLAVLVYTLYLIGILFGVTALIGVIINHTQLPKTTGTYVHSHFLWQIVSFWMLFAGAACVVILWPAASSQLIAYACVLWWLASALAGIWFLVKKLPMPVANRTIASTNRR